MLIMFRAKNFASFKDEVILDMRAVSYKDMKSHVVEIGDNKVVKTLAIYGKNASGKSNLVSAMYCFESFIFNQFFYDNERYDEQNTNQRMPNTRRTPFLLAEICNEETEFEMIFYHNGRTYQYGYSINGENITAEWLLANESEVFDRSADKIIFGKKYKKDLETINKVRGDRLYIGALDYFAVGAIKDMVDSFKEYLKHSFNVHFEVFLESSVKGFISGLNVSMRLFKDREYQKIIEQFIRVADVGIEGLIIRKRKGTDSDELRKQYEIKTVHHIYNEKGKVTGEKEFDLEMESSGTIRYFSLIQYILDMMDEGGVFVVDEMTARLHPVLTRFIVDLYQSENNRKAQLIFTTHDISLMNKNQFRRDEIAFVDKNEKGESSVYTLADIRVRSDASFSKDYLFGKYGSIPVIREELGKYQTAGDKRWED